MQLLPFYRTITQLVTQIKFLAIVEATELLSPLPPIIFSPIPGEVRQTEILIMQVSSKTVGGRWWGGVGVEWGGAVGGGGGIFFFYRLLSDIF